jgi:nucleoside-diphosphate-sugar epimerase
MKIFLTGAAGMLASEIISNFKKQGAVLILRDIHQRLPDIDKLDVTDAGEVAAQIKNVKPDYVFHLAADHGGRGYVDLHQVECSTNLILDGMIFKAAYEARVQKVVYASSGCVYPNHIQMNPADEIFLTEDMVGPPYDADNLYGWAKLMGELTLKSYYKQFGMKSACCRYFTVYGPRGVENHAVIAMIARAFIGDDPFEVWGTGEQVRNWTYIDDIVAGTILAAEKIDDATAINLGTTERIRVMDAVDEVLRYTGHKAKIVTRPEMPTGPLNRVADNSLAKKLLGWQPVVNFMDGLHRTIDWYYANKDRDQVKSILRRMLIER